ncbi:hypothetical protein ACIRQP_02505 [Streptomyces sp. NPDC102274]|uniref:hypothetical protein n=1 Tax=Streptomyces sp. NPDC102274 TaxID=3366151 RepID=UPI0038238E94
MTGSRVPALLVGVTAALTLAACGVPPSDVIQAGEPASGIRPPASAVPAAIPFYFLRDGDLTPYSRRIDDPGDFGAVVNSLFGGPTASEAATATTELPRLTAAPEVTLGSDNTFSVRLPKEVTPLSRVAMLQLACTVADVHAPFAPQPFEANQDSASGAAFGQAEKPPRPGTSMCSGTDGR